MPLPVRSSVLISTGTSIVRITACRRFNDRCDVLVDAETVEFFMVVFVAFLPDYPGISLRGRQQTDHFKVIRNHVSFKDNGSFVNESPLKFF